MEELRKIPGQENIPDSGQLLQERDLRLRKHKSHRLGIIRDARYVKDRILCIFTRGTQDMFGFTFKRLFAFILLSGPASPTSIFPQRYDVYG